MTGVTEVTPRVSHSRHEGARGRAGHAVGGDNAGELRIDRAAAADASTATGIYLRSRRAAWPEMPNGIHSDEETHAFVAEVMIAQRETWLAWEDETALGLLVLDGSKLDWLFVDPVAQSRGVGSALIEHAKARSPSGLTLWVFESNRRAQAFYERHGLVIVARTDGAGNEEKVPDIRYAWPGR
jgi:GNAT superfamily N-acetyltransferase